MLKVNCWLDSGANIHSKHETSFLIEEQEWLNMSETDQEAYAKEVAFEDSEWGFNVES